MTELNTNRDLIVLDTSAILYSADCIFEFRNCDIIVPFVVLNEVDKFRKQDNDVGRNARKFIRFLKSLIGSGENLQRGIQRLDTGEMLFVKTTSDKCKTKLLGGFDTNRNDDKILALCFELESDAGGYNKRIALITRDVALSVRANSIGLNCEDYSEDKPVQDQTNLYTGFLELVVSSMAIDQIYDIGYLDKETNWNCFVDKMYENMCVCLIDETDRKKTALARYKNGSLCLLKYKGQPVCKIKPKNMEQMFAIDMLLDDDLKLVTLTGISGTGKTLLSVACAVKQAIDDGRFDKLIISRPIQPLGQDLGFLPGDVQEKMDPWMAPIKDSIEFVFGGDAAKYVELIDFGKLQIEPMTYIRGRSIPKCLFLLDEAQNLSRHEIKTVLTRIAENSKVVLTGDILQIDNNYLDTTNNGLTCVVEKFKDSHLAGHITLKRGQRSELATLAANIL